MRACFGMVAVCAALVAAPPVAAQDAGDAPQLPGSEEILRELVRERDVSLLFDYLRQSLSAAVEGRAPPPVPEELAGRAEALGRALRSHGTLAALALLAEVEQRAKRALREKPAPRTILPPTRPFIPL
jgi:hypothetical protein